MLIVYLPPSLPHRYAGFLCGSCAKGYYKLTGRCEPCPQNQTLLLLGALLFVMFFLAVGFWLAQKLPDGLGDAITTMSIGMTFLQIIASTASVSIIDWPPEVTYVFDLAAAAMLDMQLLAPECAVSVGYLEK